MGKCENNLRRSIPKWDKDRPIREADFLPPAERRAFYHEKCKRPVARVGSTAHRHGRNT